MKSYQRHIVSFALAVSMLLPSSTASAFVLKGGSTPPISNAFEQDSSLTFSSYTRAYGWNEGINGRTTWRSDITGASVHWTEGNQLQYFNDLTHTTMAHLWDLRFSFSGTGSAGLVACAATQLGQVGGYPFWSWYGFTHREEWCACFTSWCADQLGYIEMGICPKSASSGAWKRWYEDRGQFAYRTSGYIPKEGDFVIFGWDHDGNTNHIGIVEKVENDILYTIEGNTGTFPGQCMRRKTPLTRNLGTVDSRTYLDIIGYCVPNYPAE